MVKLQTVPSVPFGNKGIIKEVDHFKYLGAYCSRDGSITKVVNNRKSKASEAFRELSAVREDRYINLDTKMHMCCPP